MRDHNKPPSICMAVGCDRKAIYRNALSARHGTQRGYCRSHKAMAVSGGRVRQDASADSVIGYATHCADLPFNGGYKWGLK